MPAVNSFVTGVLKFESIEFGCPGRSPDRCRCSSCRRPLEVDLVRLHDVVAVRVGPVVVVAVRYRHAAAVVAEEAELVGELGVRGAQERRLLLAERVGRRDPRLPVRELELPVAGRAVGRSRNSRSRKQSARKSRIREGRAREVLGLLQVVADAGCDRQVARRDRVAERAAQVLGRVDRADAAREQAYW